MYSLFCYPICLVRELRDDGRKRRRDFLTSTFVFESQNIRDGAAEKKRKCPNSFSDGEQNWRVKFSQIYELCRGVI